MADSVLLGGIGTEKTLQGACAIINKLARLGILNTTNVQAAATVAALIAAAYAALVSGTTQLFPPEARALVRLFEQYMRQADKAGVFGVDATASAVTIAALLTVNTAALTTDLRFLFSSQITLPGFDATSEADPNLTHNFSYATTG